MISIWGGERACALQDSELIPGFLRPFSIEESLEHDGRREKNGKEKVAAGSAALLRGSLEEEEERKNRDRKACN